LREEPVCYIDGIPYAPRDPDTLNINLEHLIGIESLDLETMEQRLKADIKAKAFASGNGAFSYYYQTKDMGNQVKKMILTSNRISTPRELFDDYITDFDYPLDYNRIPITDECAPEERDFDQLLQAVKMSSLTTAIVCNCQMGRGRTTTGLVCAYLILYTHGRSEQVRDEEYPDFVWNENSPDYTNGQYKIIAQLIDAINNGELIKKQVDYAIDKCQHFQNLRLAILECKDKVDKGEEVQKFTKRGYNYLERYWWLIVFNAFLSEQSPAYKMSFISWMKGKWGLKRMLKKLELK